MDGTMSERSTAARRLGGALEPVVGQVYFSPESHDEYARLGFDTSAGDMGGVALPDGPAYFTSRGSALGQVPGHVVAAAFGVFNPQVVVPAVDRGWSLTDAATIRAARDRGALGQLERLLDPRSDGADVVEEALVRGAGAVRFEGRALTSGLLSLEDPDQYDEAASGLQDRGLITDDAFTDAGRAQRERIEVETDEQMAPVLDAIGDDFDQVITILDGWGRTIREGKGYPASGPHDLADAAGR